MLWTMKKVLKVWLRGECHKHTPARAWPRFRRVLFVVHGRKREQHATLSFTYKLIICPLLCSKTYDIYFFEYQQLLH